MIDPRLAVIEKRFETVGKVLVFAGAKGGVGKTSCSCISSLLFARMGFRTGLLDLDFSGATDHVMLGIEPHFPQEASGLLPLVGPFGIRFMSIACFLGERWVAMRKSDISHAILELLTVTLWGNIDVLVIDMPPGMNDEFFDVVRLVPSPGLIVVTTGSLLSVKATERFLSLCRSMNMPVIGMLENFGSSEGACAELLQKTSRRMGVRLLGVIPALPDFEQSIGSAERLCTGGFGNALEPVLHSVC